MMMKKAYAALVLTGILAVNSGFSGCAEGVTRLVSVETGEAYSDGMSEDGEAFSAAFADGENASFGGTGSAEAGWTLMIYLCGSDLESESAMASMNLEEMYNASIPDLVHHRRGDMVGGCCHAGRGYG
jgi:hypothetical protein